MRRLMICVSLVLLALPALASDEVKEGVTATLEAQVQAWNRGDLGEFMKGYLDSPDMTYTAGGVIIRGYKALEERYASKYGSDRAGMGQLRFADLEVQALDENHALVLGRWILERQGQPSYDGVFSLVMRRVDGSWRILHDHSSVRPPPQE